MATNRKINRR